MVCLLRLCSRQRYRMFPLNSKCRAFNAIISLHLAPFRRRRYKNKRKPINYELVVTVKWLFICNFKEILRRKTCPITRRLPMNAIRSHYVRITMIWILWIDFNGTKSHTADCRCIDDLNPNSSDWANQLKQTQKFFFHTIYLIQFVQRNTL